MLARFVLCADTTLNPHRDQSALAKVKAELTIKAVDPELKPKARDEALRCKEAIEIFERCENSLAMRKMALVAAPRFDEIDIEGVAVSIRPDFLFQTMSGRVGAGIIRVAKAPDPADCKMDETKRRRSEHRREMGRYMVALFHMLLEAQNGKHGLPDRALSFVSDIRLGERIVAGTDHSARVRTIRGACRQIAKLWATIDPKPSIWKK